MTALVVSGDCRRRTQSTCTSEFGHFHAQSKDLVVQFGYRFQHVPDCVLRDQETAADDARVNASDFNFKAGDVHSSSRQGVSNLLLRRSAASFVSTLSPSHRDSATVTASVGAAPRTKATLPLSTHAAVTCSE